MNKRRIILLAACVGAALAALAAGMLFLARRTTGSDGFPLVPVKLNEIMTNNHSYPNADGITADWIELVNHGESDVDLSGYMLSDRIKTVRWTFPEGTVIPAGGYLLVTCDEGEGDALYSGFSMAKDGGEVISLLSPNHTVLDRVETVKAKKDQALARNEQGQWCVTEEATPGHENSPEGRNAYLAALSQEGESLFITEVMSRNRSVLADEDGDFSDWIEITNRGEKALFLAGYGLSDSESNPLKWRFPEKELRPGESLIVFASGKEYAGDELHSGFRLSGQGEKLTLALPNGAVFDRAEIPPLAENQAWQRQEDGSFRAVMGGTPGSDVPGAYASELEGKVQISEIMAANTAGIRDEAGRFCDWIELENLSEGPIDLTDCWLSKDPQEPFAYRLPAISLAPGEYRIFYADDQEGELYTGFALPSGGGTLTLTSPQGVLLDSFPYGKAEDDQAMARQTPGSEPEPRYEATPGMSNTQAGYLALFSQGKAPEGLIISEVMTCNSRYLPQAGGKYTDWVELYNAGEDEIDLSGYRLTDNLANDGLALPREVLKPGQYKIIFCAGEDAVSDGYHADFRLNDVIDRIYLCRGDEVADRMLLYKIGPNQSLGRMTGEDGLFFFASPTPGEKNRGGTRGISVTPRADQSEGVYAEGSTLTVQLSGAGTLYYTTNGTLPTTRSKVYKQPIEISGNTILRVMAQEDGFLPSEVLTQSYIFARHDLPVICLNGNPSDFFGPDGIYTDENTTRNMEKACNLTFLDETHGFNMNGTVKLHGATSRRDCAKKSFRITFRKQFGTNVLYCPGLFEGNELESFKSLVLRAGQDGASAMLREELFSALADELNPGLLAMDSRYVVLYINGEYWGIYALKERQDERAYADHYRVAESSVQMQKDSPWKLGAFQDVLNRIMSQDITDDKVFTELAEHVDLLSLIDWSVFQVYAANTDVSGNVRYFYSPDGDHRLRYGLFDFDLTCRDPEAKSFYDILSAGQPWGQLPARLLQNEGFRKLFCQRAAYVAATVLKESHVLAEIDRLAGQIASEVPADAKRWDRGEGHWAREVEIIRDFVKSGRTDYLLEDLARRLRITKDEWDEYFPKNAENLVFE